MSPLENAARALHRSGFSEHWPAAEIDRKWNLLSDGEQGHFRADVIAVLRAIREPTEEMIATVVRQVGDPWPEQWALGERVSASLGGNLALGEMACAELARDYTAMIDTILNTEGAT